VKPLPVGFRGGTVAVVTEDRIFFWRGKKQLVLWKSVGASVEHSIVLLRKCSCGWCEAEDPGLPRPASMLHSGDPTAFAPVRLAQSLRPLLRRPTALKSTS
jgi:hypothetical protein